MDVQHGIERFDLTRLGERVVQAARMAVAVHLFESVRGCTVSGETECEQLNGQRVVIGGADRNHVTDDELPPATRRSAR